MANTGLLIDNFAGGGGASTGIEAAMGRKVDVAINHDEAAIAVHSANHPETEHYCQSIYKVDPLDATAGAPVLLAWFSPDCKHHSKAKGGKPRDKNIRDMAWVVPHWIERLGAWKGGTLTRPERAPQVIMLENVEEFRHWGPLDKDGKPIPERKGEEFKLWITRIRRLGYKVEHRELRACDYGAPTTRKRLFLIARRDVHPIVWPEPTHGAPDSEDVKAGRKLPWRTAAECIDWSIACPSIFDRKTPLKPNTCKRIAAGVMRYVVDAAKPFIVPVTHAGGEGRVYAPDEPLPTVTGANRGEMAAVSPTLAPFVTTTRNSQKPWTAADEPMHTVVANGAHKNVVAPTLVSVAHGDSGGRREYPATDPLGTVTAKGNPHALAAASLVKLRRNSHGEDVAAPLGTVNAGGQHHGVIGATLIQTGYGERAGQSPRALDPAAPLGTVVAGGGKHAACAAFLHKYRPNSVGSAMDAPMPTVTANSFVKRGGGAPPISVCSAFVHQANTGLIGHDLRRPLSTIVGKGCTQQPVTVTLIERGALPDDMLERAETTAAFLVKYYGNEQDGHGLDAPIGTVTTRDRFAVVTVTIDSATFVLVDIGMRMLTPRELANAQGFPPDYVLDPVCTYRTDRGSLKTGPLPKSHQIAKIGNAVCPPMSEALCHANFGEAVPACKAA